MATAKPFCNTRKHNEEIKFKQFPLEICCVILHLSIPCFKKKKNFFHFRKTLLGYVYDVTNMNTAKNKTTKYFNFNIQPE